MAKQGPLSDQDLGGKYHLGELLGEGGFGMVYRGRHLLLDRPQAIKLLLERYFSRPKFRERFLREAQMIAALDHVHIVHIDDFGIEEQTSKAYLVMPFIGGGTFHDVLKEAKKQQRPLEMAQVVFYAEQIGSALDYAHQRGVVHLDLKPQNLLVHNDGRLLLADFGLAHWLKQESLDGGTSLGYGTPHYMAPEHIKGHPEKQSDVYAFGVVLYEMLVGQRPFEGGRLTPEAVMIKHLTEPPPSLLAVRPKLQPELDQVVKRALAKEGAQRYQSAGELVMAFKDALAQSSETLISHSPTQRRLTTFSQVDQSKKEGLQEAEANSPISQHTAVLSSPNLPFLNKSPRTSNKWIRILGIVFTFVWLLLIGGGTVYTINSFQDPLNTPSISYSTMYQQIAAGNIATATFIGQKYVIGTFKTPVIARNVNGEIEIFLSFHVFQMSQGNPNLLPLLLANGTIIESSLPESLNPETGIVFIVVLVFIYVSTLVFFLFRELYTQSRSKTILSRRSQQASNKWMRILGIMLTCLWLLLVGGTTLHTILQNPLQLPPDTIEISYSTFYEQIDSGNVNTVTFIGSTDIIGMFKHPTTGKTNSNKTGSSLSFHLQQPQDNPTLLPLLLQHSVTVITEPYPNSRGGIIFIVALVLVYEIALLFFLLWRRYMGSHSKVEVVM